MILSGSIPYAGMLPGWMYHAQLPPPAHTFHPTVPGLTWVDLVFPFFLFAMGAAFPFALNKKLLRGISTIKISIQIIIRGVILAGFAIYIQHFKPYALSSTPETIHWIIGIAGFILLFPILLRLPSSINPVVRYAIKISGLAAAALILSHIEYQNGTGFTLERSDIIILVLANVAVAGSLIWLFTQNNMLLRIGILGFLVALRLTHSVEGSWNQWLWNYSPFPWLYKLYYLQYLFIVIPGTVVGDLIYKWMNTEQHSEKDSPELHFRVKIIFTLMISFIIINLITLYTRQLETAVLLNILYIVLGHILFNGVSGETLILLKKMFRWGSYWLLLGLFFEAFEGGIKKDQSTLSYYFVATGLAIFSYIALSIITDYFRKKSFLKTIIQNGQNPMIAYIAGSNLIMPVLTLTGLTAALNYLLVNPWLGFLKGCIITLMVALVTKYFAVKKLFWRT